MPTWKRSGGTCFLLRRLWTCSVALLEKGCEGDSAVSPRAEGTAARQGRTRQEPTEEPPSTGLGCGSQGGACGGFGAPSEDTVGTLGTSPRPCCLTPGPGTHMGAGQQLLHDVMVEDVAAPGGSLLLRVQLLVLLDLDRAQFQWHRGTQDAGNRGPSGCHVPWESLFHPLGQHLLAPWALCPWCLWALEVRAPPQPSW